MVISLTPEEEATLLPEYEKYCREFPQYGFPAKYALSFDDWWRAMADNYPCENYMQLKGEFGHD